MDVPNVNLISAIKTSGITLSDREEYLSLAHHDKGFREDFAALCAMNAVFCISTTFWIFEPRGSDEFRELPFILRDFQEEYVRNIVYCIDNGVDSLTKKTREMGVTWCILGVLAQKWLFERKFTAKLGSMTRDMVDKKDDEDALFPKLDFIIEMLRVDAPFLYPKGYAAAQPFRTHMKMLNPVTDSVITGAAPTARFGRGGRQKCIFMDELQEWPFQSASWTSSSKTTDCRIVVGTPNGPHNLFARLANPHWRKSEQEQSIVGTKPMKIFQLHWKQDRTKNEYQILNAAGEVVRKGHGDPDNVPYTHRVVWPWYEEQKVKFDYDPTKLAQEIDIDFNRSTAGQMYPQIERSRMKDFIGFDPALELYTAIDFGIEDSCAIGWFQYNQYTLRWSMLDYIERNGKSILYFIPFIMGGNIAVGAAENYTEDDLRIIERHSGWWPYYTDHFGDPAGKARNPVTATSVIDALTKYNIFVRTNDAARYHEPRYNAARLLLPLLDINMAWCGQWVEHMRGARWQPRLEGADNAAPRKPVHDKTSHGRSMFEYLAVNNPHAVDAQAMQYLKDKHEAEQNRPVFGDIRFLQALQNPEVREYIYGNENWWEDRSGYGIG